MVNTSVFRTEKGATYGTDADLLRDIWLRIHIDLIKFDCAVRLRELLKDGGDESARATPRSPEVDDDGFARSYLIAPELTISERVLETDRDKIARRTMVLNSSYELIGVTVITRAYTGG